MSVVPIEIAEPLHDTPFFGAPSVTLRGASLPLPTELAGVAIYYRWYSSLFSGSEDDIKQEKFAMNSVDGTVLTAPDTPYTLSLGPGTHVITFAATDQPGETSAEQEAVQHGGVTGGATGDAPCMMHIFKANIIEHSDGDTISRAVPNLQAEAPALWGQTTDVPDVYAPNEEYHKVNRLQYRWRFAPIGAPANRPLVEIVPALDDLVFRPQEAETEVTRVQYHHALPNTLTGAYTLTLHVEDSAGQLGGDSMSLNNIEIGP